MRALGLSSPSGCLTRRKLWQSKAQWGNPWGDLQRERVSALGVSWMREAEACQVGDRLNRNLKRGRAQRTPGHHGTTTVSLGRKCETCSRINHQSRGQIWAASPIGRSVAARRGHQIPYDCCQLPCGCQESSLCPLEEQPSLNCRNCRAISLQPHSPS